MKPQKCEVSRVVDGENWEDYIWPNKGAQSGSVMDSSLTKKLGSMTVNNKVQGNGNIILGGNIVQGSLTINYPRV